VRRSIGIVSTKYTPYREASQSSLQSGWYITRHAAMLSMLSTTEVTNLFRPPGAPGDPRAANGRTGTATLIA
jgi:hypothetical protein